MTKENRLRKLEKKKFELIKNIKLCNDYKKEVILNWNKLKESFNQGFVSHEEYYRRLSKSKYNEWIRYYDDSIKYNKNKLNEYYKEISKEERRAQIIPIIAVIAVLVLIGFSIKFIEPTITGFAVSEFNLNVEGVDNYKSDEIPVFDINLEERKGNLITGFAVKVPADKNIKAILIDPSGKEKLLEKEIINTDKGFSIKLDKERGFKAGLYKLKVKTIYDDKEYIEEQDFTWGVLAINVDKSIYLENETTFIGIAVLDNEGHMICDADVVLEIINPSNIKTVLSTKNGLIKISPECKVYGVTSLPDYYTNYNVSKIGTYVMKLTAVTESGIRNIEDKFEVKKEVEFDVKREGPTRIFPLVNYIMNFTIKANKDYIGEIKEYVPANFEITPQDDLIIIKVENTKILKWNKKLSKGGTYNIYYEFDAPDISPYLFILGELEINDWKELRKWQIASDAPDEVFMNATWIQACYELGASSGDCLLSNFADVDEPDETSQTLDITSSTTNLYAYMNTTHGYNIPDGSAITGAQVCIKGSSSGNKLGDQNTDECGVAIGENSSGGAATWSWLITPTIGDNLDCVDFFITTTSTLYCYNAFSFIGNNEAKAENTWVHVYALDIDDRNYDLFIDWVYVNISYTAANQNPSNPAPLINSTDSLQLNYTNETLACNFLCSDLDTEASMTYDVSWYKNGIPDIQFSSQSCTDESYVSTNLESGNTTKNDLWACSVNLTDDESASSSTIFSDNITIENYVPTVDVFSNVTSTEDIGTITVITNADLNANFSDIDAADSAPTTYEIISQENTTVKCYFDPNVLKCDSVANQSGSNNIKFSLNDSSGAGAITDFDVTLTAVNDAPTILELNLPNNNTQIEENIFTVELNWSNVSDLDPDLDSYTYYLEIWNESDTLNILYVNSSISETTNTTSDLVTFPSETADYFWRVLANDGTANSSWSELRNISFSYLITNTAPSEPTGVLLNSTLTAQTNLTNENLAANFLCSDPDTLDTLTYDIYFYKEGIYNQSMLTISCSDPEYVSYIFDETNTSKGENWSFSVNVTDIGGLSSPTVFSNNLTIENSAPEIIYVSLNNTIAPFDGGLRKFEFSFVANDNDTTADLDDTKAIANVSFSTENYLNNSCYAEGDVTGGRNYSCTIEMQYYYASGSWNYATEIKDNSGIAIQNSTNDNNEVQTWYYSELTALNLSVSVLTWAQLIPSQTNQTATSNPIVIENTGNKAILNIFAKAIDLIGASGKYIPAANFTIGNITSASQAECDYTNQTSAVTPGVTPLIFINNTNIYPVINTLARGQGSSNNLYYCLFDVPSNLQSESYSTKTGTEWDISVE